MIIEQIKEVDKIAETNRNAYGRINEFLREGNNREEEFTIQEIAQKTSLSSEMVKAIIEMVLEDEKLFTGGPSITKGRKDGSYRCRTKYLDEIII